MPLRKSLKRSKKVSKQASKSPQKGPKKDLKDPKMTSKRPQNPVFIQYLSYTLHLFVSFAVDVKERNQKGFAIHS